MFQFETKKIFILRLIFDNYVQLEAICLCVKFASFQQFKRIGNRRYFCRRLNHCIILTDQFASVFVEREWERIEYFWWNCDSLRFPIFSHLFVCTFLVISILFLDLITFSLYVNKWWKGIFWYYARIDCQNTIIHTWNTHEKPKVLVEHRKKR